MANKILLSLSLIILFGGCQKASDKDRFITDNKIKSDSITIGAIHTLTSKVLNEEREIIISLPVDYEKSKSSYPVLYLTDGFQNIEHVRGSVELLTRTGHIPPLIIVGIKSVDRVRDFTYSQSESQPKSGGAEKFLSFIESELIPYINTNYRANGFNVLEGHSLGGLFAASTLMQNPDLFQAFIIMSPALWWNKEKLTQKAESFFTNHPNLEKKLFFGIGKDESTEDFGMRKELNNFIDVVKENKPKNLLYSHKEFENEGHMSSTLLSNYYGLRYVFSDLKYSDEFIANYSDEVFLKKEDELIAKYGASAKRTGESYYNLGAAIYQRNIAGAITVFKRSVEVYPNDINLITTLAQLYESNSEIVNAINTYEYAIEVSGKNKYGKEESYQKEIDRLKSNSLQQK
ncbi:alpha/beta hydrolase-fold protein [uncultured Draconibacterium sp.]|uniref:alpha/beta hydrolase n=1 Tax=uncultured Draconibacterium sp. TaxID=1573823 RepID=UPI002AA6C1AD|nr:alpha/beta hydrolase-fold protein [uncultured Draconibacterium sp.]